MDLLTVQLDSSYESLLPLQQAPYYFAQIVCVMVYIPCQGYTAAST